MEAIPIPKGTPVDQENFYRTMFQEAQGSMIELDAVPTGSALKAGQIGYYSTDIYIVTPTGTKIKLAGTSWS